MAMFSYTSFQSDNSGVNSPQAPVVVNIVPGTSELAVWAGSILYHLFMYSTTPPGGLLRP